MIETTRIIGHLLSILNIPSARLTPENEREWREMLSLARKERIYYSLAGLILENRDRIPPPVIESEMRGELSANAIRTVLLCSQISALARLFREAGIQLLFLKGAADLIRGIYPPGWRFMSDLDIMVNEAHLATASALLTEQGYFSLPDGVEQVHHQPQLFHRDYVGTVELHTASYPTGRRSGVVMPGIWKNADEMTFHGEPVLAPNPTDHLWIMMRSDVIRKAVIPRLFDTIEYCLLTERGLGTNFQEIDRRARKDGMPNLLPALSRACGRFGGMDPFAEGDERQLERWEEWSIALRRKEITSAWFHSARRRFTALWFIHGGGCWSRFGFVLRLAKEIITIDRFTPGPYRGHSFITIIYRYCKMFFAFIFAAFEYLIFVLMNRSVRR